jgi:uncharacterized protein YqgC (DUF456 family)
MRALARNACGIVLIVAGLIAMPIPIVPGVPLIAAGVAVLGNDHPLVRSCRTWLDVRGIWKRQGVGTEPRV